MNHKKPITMDKYYNLIIGKIENLQSLTKRNPLLFSQTNQLEKNFIEYMALLVTAMNDMRKIAENKNKTITEKELIIDKLQKELALKDHLSAKKLV